MHLIFGPHTVVIANKRTPNGVSDYDVAWLSCHLSPDNCRRLASSGSYWQLHEISFLGARGKAWD